MHLKDVRSFGSEGRRGADQGEIPAHDTVQPTVIFKVDHIKDFKIVKRPPAEIKQKELDSMAIMDDAIMAATGIKEKTRTPAKTPQPSNGQTQPQPQPQTQEQ